MRTLTAALAQLLILASPVFFATAQVAEIGRVSLSAKSAELVGEQLTYDAESATIQGLHRPEDSVHWSFAIDKPGWYQVVVHYALPAGKSTDKSGFNATIGDQNRLGPIHPTGQPDRFLPQVLFDPVNLPKGDHRLKLQLVGPTRLSGLRIQRVELLKAPEPGVP